MLEFPDKSAPDRRCKCHLRARDRQSPERPTHFLGIFQTFRNLTYGTTRPQPLAGTSINFMALIHYNSNAYVIVTTKAERI